MGEMIFLGAKTIPGGERHRGFNEFYITGMGRSRTVHPLPSSTMPMETGEAIC
jgi:hypothetical protein